MAQITTGRLLPPDGKRGSRHGDEDAVVVVGALTCVRDSHLLSSVASRDSPDLFYQHIVCHMGTMALEAQTQIVPADFPELRRLAWNRVPERAMDMADVFHLYERNWRFVDKDHLTVPERQLIDRLGDLFGQGFRLV